MSIADVRLLRLCIVTSRQNIRAYVQNGRSIRYMTPDPVVDYIEEHGLFIESS
jgi:nicotinic acid mononucleotide adenylyltransferase